MAAADVLTLYLRALDGQGNLVESGAFTLICEFHEDWAVVLGPNAEIVSGKHREASVGQFSTYLQVLDLGGVLHLFKRWLALQESPLCRLVTTAGLSDDAAKVDTACEKLREDIAAGGPIVEDVVQNLARLIGSLTAVKGEPPSPPSPATVRAFLASLRFQHSQPRRDHLPDMAAERYGRPVCERLGRADGAGAVWKAVLALVRPRMRAAGPSKGGALPTVLGVPNDDALRPRSLTLVDVDLAIRFALDHLGGYEPLPRIVKANKMSVKMAHGGCSDNAIERADDLRLQYRRYWRSLTGNPTTSDRQRRIVNTLRRVVDEATHAVRTDGKRWGAELWLELDQRFRLLEGQAEAQSLNAELLLGGVSELANNCSAWYSDAFDAEQQLRLMVAQRAAR
ncbi:hypothetical protein GR927_22980 [Mycolicibacterium sp. 3033]|nr:hypothetical protein [Mycolicibacterium aurantiacum]